ncbi:hypothetical protein LMG3481_00129 [Achromobacter deleyi]|jgi:hypothetical protein|nr:hypothetical protein LMG3481_00129 [Achromobacter deleyi]
MLHLLRVVFLHARAASAGVRSAGRAAWRNAHWMADSNQFYIALAASGGRHGGGR